MHHATVEQKYKDNKAKERSEIAEIYSQLERLIQYLQSKDSTKLKPMQLCSKCEKIKLEKGIFSITGYNSKKKPNTTGSNLSWGETSSRDPSEKGRKDCKKASYISMMN